MYGGSYLLKSGLDGQLGRVTRVNSAHEGVDEPLERLWPQVSSNELLHALLVVRGGGQHQPDGTKPGPAVMSITRANVMEIW